MAEAQEAGETRSFDLSAQREDLVFRSESTSPARMAEALVSLANAGGGTLLLGVDARTGQPHGLADPDDALDRALQAALAADPPLIIPLPQVIEIDGEELLAVSVPPGLPHVYSYKGKYLVREGTRTHPLKPRQLRRLMMERGAVTFESGVPDGVRLDDVDWEKASRYLNTLEGWRAGDAQEVLLRRGCLARTGEEVRPTYAGLLLFGREPQRWVPSAEILVARYHGNRMEDSFVKEEVRGTLPEQIRQAEAFVLANMRRGVRLSGLERVEEAEYPAEAVREAIVNAVAHRDYQIRGDEIRVFMFANRVEFYSPGRLPGHVTVENLVRERFSRNEIVVQILSDMGFIERLGYGIDRMIRLMTESGLDAPRFDETAAGFHVTLPGRGEELMDEEPAAGQWRHLDLNERQEKALAYLVEHGRITNREFQELVPDVSAETIRRDLADMVDKNLLLKIGEKRATYYILK